MVSVLQVRQPCGLPSRSFCRLSRKPHSSQLRKSISEKQELEWDRGSDVPHSDDAVLQKLAKRVSRLLDGIYESMLYFKRCRNRHNRLHKLAWSCIVKFLFATHRCYSLSAASSRRAQKDFLVQLGSCFHRIDSAALVK